MYGKAYVGDKVVMDGHLVAQIVKIKKNNMNQPLAYVHPQAKIAPNVVIEPFVNIEKM